MNKAILMGQFLTMASPVASPEDVQADSSFPWNIQISRY